MVQREEMYFEPRCVGSDLRINKIREDYTPKETHSKDFDGCQKEIKEIRQNYLTIGSGNKQLQRGFLQRYAEKESMMGTRRGAY